MGWYTASGFTDECGHYHHSGLRYDWEFLSVLNENEHEMVPSTQYTTCFDRWREEIAKVKMPDLSAYDMDQAVRIIAGSARSMGIETEGV